MLVGQAPGKTEVGDRRAFAGRAGRTLFRWLLRAGIDEEGFREKVYIAAMTRCYPGPNPTEGRGGRGDRVPTPRERAACASWLDDELRIIKPQLLIPVGRLAIDRFIGCGRLDEIIGAEHLVSYSGGESRAIPLPHPSGASSWINDPSHKSLLDRALVLLRNAFAELWDVRPRHRQGRTASCVP